MLPLSDANIKPTIMSKHITIAAAKTNQGVIAVTATGKDVTYWVEFNGKMSAVAVGPMSHGESKIWPRASAIHMGSWWEDHKAHLDVLAAAAFGNDYPDESIWFSREQGTLPAEFVQQHWNESAVKA